MTLDLSYDAPPPPSDLADRARGRSRTIRRRRRATGALALGAALAGAGVVGVQVSGGGDHETVRVATPVESLPAYVGTGPSLASLALPGHPVGNTVDSRTAEPVDERHALSGGPTGRKAVVFISKELNLCYEATEANGTGGGQCGLPVLPERGFAAISVGASNGGANRITGLVLGPVTRVHLTTPLGDENAQLFPAPLPELGQLLYVNTPYVDAQELEGSGSRITAYDGDTPVYSCLVLSLDCSPNG